MGVFEVPSTVKGESKVGSGWRAAEKFVVRVRRWGSGKEGGHNLLGALWTAASYLILLLMIASVGYFTALVWAAAWLSSAILSPKGHSELWARINNLIWTFGAPSPSSLAREAPPGAATCAEIDARSLNGEFLVSRAPDPPPCR
eukprot:CAMPEP_0174917546 /NCGR_PEP_ID=MMETSP1355-20121228/2533_1 /TAXON_ID=464990 /ORGANISM="Hemiselmis tepida, Strain CCMP443" /LENGTH=143 /DNA_ID=CAMNT_0016162653 /DNA_START=116 /DNA_END=544 /DNA_ORIENTATION=+